MSTSDKLKTLFIGGGASSAIVLIVLLIFKGLFFAFIPPATVGVESFFGKVTPDVVLLPGAHFKAPWTSVTKISVQPSPYEIDSKDIGRVGDLNKTPMEFDATIPLNINPACAPDIVAHGGVEFIMSFIKRQAPAAMRNASATFTWEEMMTTKRMELAQLIRTDFVTSLTKDFTDAGFTPTQAKSCLVVYDVQLQSLTPPSQITDAIAERSATEVAIATQKNLDEIAARQAARRSTEGEGIKNIMNQLPTNFTPAQVAQVMNAVAIKENADSLERAVREGKINTIVLPMSQPNALTVPEK